MKIINRDFNEFLTIGAMRPVISWGTALVRLITAIAQVVLNILWLIPSCFATRSNLGFKQSLNDLAEGFGHIAKGTVEMLPFSSIVLTNEYCLVKGSGGWDYQLERQPIDHPNALFIGSDDGELEIFLVWPQKKRTAYAIAQVWHSVGELPGRTPEGAQNRDVSVVTLKEDKLLKEIMQFM